MGAPCWSKLDTVSNRIGLRKLSFRDRSLFMAGPGGGRRENDGLSKKLGKYNEKENNEKELHHSFGHSRFASFA